jgi:hypothetical protein
MTAATPAKGCTNAAAMLTNATSTYAADENASQPNRPLPAFQPGPVTTPQVKCDV